MSIWKKSVLFTLGGCAYMGLETLWRGWSHGSMFLAGGSSFLLLGVLHRKGDRMPMAIQAFLGAGIITGVELAAGLLANRDYSVWDYRHLPMNYQGQICLPFSLLWVPVSLGAMVLYDVLESRLPDR